MAIDSIILLTLTVGFFKIITPLMNSKMSQEFIHFDLMFLMVFSHWVRQRQIAKPIKMAYLVLCEGAFTLCDCDCDQFLTVHEKQKQIAVSNRTVWRGLIVFLHWTRPIQRQIARLIKIAHIELYDGAHTAPRSCQWSHWLLFSALSSVLLHKPFLVSLRETKFPFTVETRIVTSLNK